MNEQQRFALMVQTLHRVKSGLRKIDDGHQVNVATFHDRGSSNTVQVYFWVHEETSVFVTKTKEDSATAFPELTKQQVNALRQIGFRRTKRGMPLHQLLCDLDSPELVARLCQQGFTILGSSPSFELVAATSW